jgi:ribosome-binding protein aMBF1 (putative translation factor)
MAHSLVCWKCGAALAALSLPLMRRDECPACHAELHVCRMCRDYDTAVAKQCREPTAEEVSDKAHANFCGHYAPRDHAWRPADTTAAAHALSELEKLFAKN